MDVVDVDRSNFSAGQTCSPQQPMLLNSFLGIPDLQVAKATLASNHQCQTCQTNSSIADGSAQNAPRKNTARYVYKPRLGGSNVHVGSASNRLARSFDSISSVFSEISTTSETKQARFLLLSAKQANRNKQKLFLRSCPWDMFVVCKTATNHAQ